MAVLFASVYAHPLAGTFCGGSSRWTRCVNVAFGASWFPEAAGIGQRERGRARHDVFVTRTGDGLRDVILTRPARSPSLPVRLGGRGCFPSRSIRSCSRASKGTSSPAHRISECCRVIQRFAAVWRVVERLVRLATAVRRLIHHFMVALAQIQGLQDIEIVLIHDVAVRVYRRELDVGNDRILQTSSD